MNAPSQKYLTASGEQLRTRVAWLTIPMSCVILTPLAGAAETTSVRTLEEVIVTAQKRSERLEDVPISISVLGGEQLDRFTGGITEALALVPGVKISQEGLFAAGSTQLGIRGVSASGPAFNGSSPIAYYVDSVPFGLVKSAIVPDSNAYDLDRIEVLRGPQGTLYGASALNGVIRVLTNDADLQSFEMKARASIATTERGSESYRGDVAVNVPLIQNKLAARLVLGYNDMGGWLSNLNATDYNDAEISNGRLKIHSQPTDQMSIGMSAWMSRSDFGAPSIANDQDVYPGVLGQPGSVDYDLFGFTVAYDFAAFSVTSMTSYIDFASVTKSDLSPFGTIPIFLSWVTTTMDSEVLAQELVFNSTHEGNWRWSAGGFYRDAEDRLVQDAPTLLPLPVDFSDQSESFAVFGELTRAFMSGKLELTAGLRYFEDEVTQIENQPQTGNPADPVLPPNSDTFDATSPRVVLTWHPTDTATLYASYSEGFRSGFNQNANVIRARPDFIPVEADKLKNYEIGAKGRLFDGRVSYDTSLYYIDWNDVQQTVQVEIPTGSSNIFTAVVNGESASGLGADLALGIPVTDGLNLGLSFSWNDLALDATVAQSGIVIFNDGDRMNYSSEYTTGVSIDYSFSLGGSGLEGGFAASANYSSKVTQRDLRGTTLTVLEGEDILSGRTSFSIGDPDRWTASLFVDNPSNERNVVIQGAFPHATPRPRPRTIGLQFEYTF